ncbi:SDR family oxidoreductase [Rhizobium sp. FKL33]|uniref:SDR family oxidoreductase n=1 Tax=Rhizobium sp. FKL33 TaxID=2562307 RepID=UPI0010C0F118|nr:SDR family oxidoreductase [Rhizobium sp. FKL33]
MNKTHIKSALVTGGSTRIGAAIVKDLAENGFAVAIHANGSVTQAQELCDAIRSGGGRAAVVQADLCEATSRGRIVSEAVAEIGPLGLVVNNASIFEDDTVEDFDEEVFERHFAVHVKAPAALTRGFAAQLPEDAKGLVVNMVDQRVWALNPRFFTYTLSKAALWTATQTMAQALAPKIRVNAIGPGPTLKNQRQTDEDFAAQVHGLILKEGPSLPEFGRTIRFLFDTPSITGQMIALDGGQHLAWQTPDVAEIKE